MERRFRHLVRLTQQSAKAACERVCFDCVANGDCPFRPVAVAAFGHASRAHGPSHVTGAR